MQKANKIPDYVVILRWFFGTLVLICFFSMNDIKNENVQVQAKSIPTISPSRTPSPTPKVQSVVKAATSVESPPLSPIENEIKIVFGKYYSKALKIAKCESSLNPRAINDNRKWGGVGRDRGVFQINDMYHPLTDAQAFDYKQNIRYAYRMFVNDGNTFRRWTCGNFYGI